MSTVIALATTTGRVLVVPPSAAPAGAEWAVIRLDHTPEHHLTIEFERSADGQAWESAGSVTFGDDHTRDYTFPMHYRVRASISADGYTYRVYVDSGAAEVTYQGYFDFEGSRAAVALGAGVEIAGYERLEIGSPAHYNLIQNCTLPPLAGLTGENCAVAVIIARHNNTPVGGELGWTAGNPDYGDHEVVRWGGSGGVTLERLLFSENQISASVCGYCATGVSPDDNPRVYAQWTTPPEWYLSRPNPFNNLTPHVTIAAIALKHVRQSDPIRGLWRACTQPVGSMLGCGASTALDTVDGNVPTSPGDVVIGAASLIVVENDPGADITAGGVVLSHHLWSHATTGPGADSWVGVIDAKEAGVGAQTSMSYTASFDIAHQTNFTGAAFAFAQTEYVHHVAILTPEDLGDLPDADQVRAGTDGFGAPALDYQKRGPDASGRVTFDPFVGDIPEQTDISLGFVYEGEDVVAWAHITTAQAVHYVAVETPEDPEGLPTAAQIKAGTDGDGSPALDYQARTLAAGTVTFSPTTGAEIGKSYTLAFVTGDEQPVFADAPQSIMVDGSASASASAAGALTTAIPLDGEAAVASAEASGTLTTSIQASGDAQASVVATAELTTAIPLVGASITVSTAAGAITTSIPLDGAAVSAADASGAIETAIQLAGDGVAQASATGTIGGGAMLSGSAMAGVTATGDLLTEIRLTGAAVASAMAAAGIDTEILLAGAAAAQASAGGELAGDGAALSGSAQASAQASGELTVQIRLAGDAIAASVASGALTVSPAGLAGDAQASAQASGALTTVIQLSGAAAAVATASGSIMQPIALQGAGASVVHAIGSLDTSIRLDAAALATATAVGVLTVQIQFDGAAIARAVAAGVLTSGLVAPSRHRTIYVPREERWLKVRA